MGRADVDGLEEELTDAQLREWVSFFELEPWGAEIGFMQSGIVAATVVNSNPNRKPGAKAASPKDFMPEFGKGAKPDDGAGDAKALRAELLSAFAGRTKRKDDGGTG